MNLKLRPYLLYRSQDWRKGNAHLSAHETMEQAKQEALRLSNGVPYLANSNYCVAYDTTRTATGILESLKKLTGVSLE